VQTTHYIIGSVVGLHPSSQIVRDVQSIISRGTIEQSQAQFGRLPNVVVACVGGGGGNATGMGQTIEPCRVSGPPALLCVSSGHPS